MTCASVLLALSKTSLKFPLKALVPALPTLAFTVTVWLCCIGLGM